MGVYIKGMEMPSCCAECDFCGGFIMPDEIYTCDCPTAQSLNITRAIDEDCRNPHCPLVPVPPHGRLGDLDEINEKHDKLSRDFCHGYFKNTWDFVCAARKIFYDAPTIIPAEEGE